MNPPTTTAARLILRSLFASAVCLSTLSAATYYWDTNGATAGLGGSGDWNTSSAHWSTSNTGGVAPFAWNNTTNAADLAEFRGVDGGVVTVDAGGITAASLVTELSTTGAYTFQGGPITLTGTTLLNGKSGGDITVGTNLIANFATVTADRAFLIQTNQANTVTIDGNITFAASSDATGIKTVQLRGTHADSVIIFNGTLGGSPGGTASTRLQVNGSSTSKTYINGDNILSTAGAQVVNGIAYLGHNNALGSGNAQLTNSGTVANGTAAILTNGARTIATNISAGKTGDATTQMIIGGSTAHVSEYSGNISGGNNASSNLRLSAASGGRVNFSGTISGTGGTGLFIKEGAGVVAFTRLAGNTYNRNTEVHAGALILANTSGSATGTGNTLTVFNGATLAGTGISTSAVIANGATSRFSAGDMNQNGVSSIGTLHLTGGLSASSGATFDFDLNGAQIDAINFGTSALTLGGTVTVDFTSLGTVQTGVAYSLFAGSGTWNSVSATFVINGPDGYMLDTTYGGGTGYLFNDATNSFTVQFAAIPEPSTYTLLLGAAGLALATARRTRRSL